VEHNAAELARGLRGAVSPYEVGFVRDTEVRCGQCRMFDPGRPGEEESHCDFFRQLTEKMPEIFDLDKRVDASDCCNAWNAFPVLGEPNGSR
jgi:hypothetical protein